MLRIFWSILKYKMKSYLYYLNKELRKSRQNKSSHSCNKNQIINHILVLIKVIS